MGENLEKQNRTKQKLKKALIDLCNQKGYYNTTIKDICDTAGTYRSTFYRKMHESLTQICEDTALFLLKMIHNFFNVFQNRLSGSSESCPSPEEASVLSPVPD